MYLVCRTTGLSDYRTVRLLDRRIICLTPTLLRSSILYFIMFVKNMCPFLSFSRILHFVYTIKYNNGYIYPPDIRQLSKGSDTNAQRRFFMPTNETTENNERQPCSK